MSLLGLSWIIERNDDRLNIKQRALVRAVRGVSALTTDLLWGKSTTGKIRGRNRCIIRIKTES